MRPDPRQDDRSTHAGFGDDPSTNRRSAARPPAARIVAGFMALAGLVAAVLLTPRDVAIRVSENRGPDGPVAAKARRDRRIASRFALSRAQSMSEHVFRRPTASRRTLGRGDRLAAAVRAGWPSSRSAWRSRPTRRASSSSWGVTPKAGSRSSSARSTARWASGPTARPSGSARSTSSGGSRTCSGPASSTRDTTGSMCRRWPTRPATSISTTSPSTTPAARCSSPPASAASPRLRSGPASLRSGGRRS